MELLTGIAFVMAIVGGLKMLYEKFYADKLPKAVSVIFVGLSSIMLCLVYIDGDLKTRVAQGLIVWLTTMGVYSAGKAIKRESLNSILILALCLSAFSVQSCARNTNSVNIGGTGMFVEALGGLLALGNFEAHIATSELSEEQLVVTDTKFFDGSGVLGAGDGEGVDSTLNTQRSYSMKVMPVEAVATEEEVEE